MTSLPERMDRALEQPTYPRYADPPLPPGGVSPLNRLADSLFNLGIFKRVRKRLGGRPAGLTILSLVSSGRPNRKQFLLTFFFFTFPKGLPRSSHGRGEYDTLLITHRTVSSRRPHGVSRANKWPCSKGRGRAAPTGTTVSKNGDSSADYDWSRLGVTWNQSGIVKIQNTAILIVGALSLSRLSLACNSCSVRHLPAITVTLSCGSSC